MDTQAPASPLARALAGCRQRWVESPPRSRQGALRFELDASPAEERWTRDFPDRTMTSRLHAQGDALIETLGAARLTFRLREVAGAMEMQLAALRFLGIPCPRWLLPKITARETGDHEHLHFDVSAALPWIGQVARYRGTLHVPG